MWGSESRGCFYHPGSPPLLSFGSSVTLAKDPNLIFYISQSIGTVFLWCFLLFSGLGCLGVSCCSPGIPLVLEEVLSSSGATGLSLSQPSFACQVLPCFLLDLQSCLGERSGLFQPRGRVERKEFSITCRGGSGNVWAEAAATPSPRDNPSHTGSRVIGSWLLQITAPCSDT